ncbi:hypothetical protein ACO0E1_16120 [Curtobacterium sp. RRHDQ66]|uniref:hypothetical protein n=1 Tax=Curtobacterium guangdongense TaxID=3413380 RepID=UPI003BF23E5C
MLLRLVDESFKDDLYRFGAVVADALQTREIATRIQGVVSALAEFGIDGAAEVHAHPIFHADTRQSRSCIQYSRFGSS